MSEAQTPVTPPEMDDFKAAKALNSLELFRNDASSKKTPVLSHRITKRSRSTNKVIKYFQDINKRRIRSDPKEITPMSYQPFSRDALYDRIVTFQSCTNPHLTSVRLNAVEMSLRGWKYIKDAELYCETCFGRFKLKFTEDEELNDRLEKVFLNKLEDGHDGNCPWRKQYTPKSVYEISFTNLDNELAEFESSYSKNINDTDINLVRLLTDDDMDTVKKYLASKQFEINETSLQLALFGWEKAETTNSVTILRSKSDARRIIVKDARVDLLDEHHSWSNVIEGYGVLLQIIKAAVANFESAANPSFPTQYNSEEKNGVDGDGHEDHPPSHHIAETVDETLSRLSKLRKLFE